MESSDIVFEASDVSYYPSVMAEEARMVRNFTALRCLILFAISWGLILALSRIALLVLVGIVILAVLLLFQVMKRFLFLRNISKNPLTVTKSEIRFRGAKIPNKALKEARLIRYSGCVEFVYAPNETRVRLARILPVEFVDTPRFLRALSLVGVKVMRVDLEN